MAAPVSKSIKEEIACITPDDDRPRPSTTGHRSYEYFKGELVAYDGIDAPALYDQEKVDAETVAARSYNLTDYVRDGRQMTREESERHRERLRVNSARMRERKRLAKEGK